MRDYLARHLYNAPGTVAAARRHLTRCATAPRCCAEYTNKVIDEDTVAGVDPKICGCFPWSPLPCCTYCGVGPCAGEFRFKRKAPGSNTWIGSGCPFAGCPTACASCDQCSHNNDEFTIDDQHDGKTAETPAYMTPGGVRPPPAACAQVLWLPYRSG